MIITLLAWLYITILCRIWGVLILITVKKISRDDKSMPVHFSISCFLGLAGITVFASLLSLFIPLGGWLAQLLIVAPCTLLLFIKPGQRIFPELKKNFSRSHTILITLIFFCLILVLHTSSWKITNEDTLGYHAQIIQWIEKYKAVPGIANLHLRYGFQSPWFVSCALFSFSFTGTNALTFINSAILFWYFIFMISQVNEYFLGQTNIATSFLWLAFLMFSLWNYSLVRLTADSASPDFVAVIYTWIVFYLLLNKKFRETNTSNFLLLILTSVFAFTVKLSAFPIILISVYGAYELLRVKKIRALLFSLLIAVLILIPFGARNI
ncbi:MAG TPA: hypothetical protein VET23_03695, partial [Chitinophagaceae bacterium]|nr:hypothetical protein [Chitinophagaceae bacterium]